MAELLDRERELRAVEALAAETPPAGPPAGAGSFAAPYLALATGPAFDPALAAAVEAQLALAKDALRGDDSGRAYGNFAERAVDADAFFGSDDHARLRAIKGRVDPDATILANHPV